MKKEIAKVYANKIEKKLNNNKSYSVTRNEEKVLERGIENNINQKIKSIFKSKNYIYKAKVEITLKDKTILKTIIGIKNNNLITIDNELISVSDIVDIKYVN